MTDPQKRKKYDSSLPFDDKIPKESDLVDDETFFELFKKCFATNAKFAVVKPVPDMGDMNTPIADVYKFYKYLQEKYKDEIYIKRIEIFFSLEFEEKKEENFYQTIAELRKQGYEIDIYNDSFAYFLGVKNAVNYANKRNNAKNKVKH